MATTKNTKGKTKDKTPPDPNALRVEVQPDDNKSGKAGRDVLCEFENNQKESNHAQS